MWGAATAHWRGARISGGEEGACGVCGGKFGGVAASFSFSRDFRSGRRPSARCATVLRIGSLGKSSGISGSVAVAGIGKIFVGGPPIGATGNDRWLPILLDGGAGGCPIPPRGVPFSGSFRGEPAGKILIRYALSIG